MIIANVAAALPGERDLRLVDITIKEGKIAAIKEAKGLKAANRSNTDSEQDADEDILDAKGLFVFPGRSILMFTSMSRALRTEKIFCTALRRPPVAGSPQ